MLNDLIGKPFVNGGRGPDGFDCYGLAREVMRRFDQPLPPDLSCDALHAASCELEFDRQRLLRCWRPVLIPAPGTLIAIKNHPLYVNHVGVLLSGGRFIHCLERLGVCLDLVHSPAWSRRIHGYYEYVG